jgi:hypothetical protein
MRLIEIARLKRRAEDGIAIPKQGGRMPRSLNLLIVAQGHAGSSAEVSLDGPPAHPNSIACHYGIGR